MTVFVVLDDVAASTEENTAVSSAPAMRERNMMNRVVIRSAVVSSSFPSSKFPFAGLKTPWRAFCYIFERRYIVHNMRLFWPKKWCLSERLSRDWRGSKKKQTRTTLFRGCIFLFNRLYASFSLLFYHGSEVKMDKAQEFFRFSNDVPRYRSLGWQHSTTDVPYLGLTIAFMTFIFLVEIILDYRQLTKFEETKKLPKQLEGIIEKEVFEKANACT